MTTKIPFILLNSFESTEQIITGSSNATIAHGLGAVPKDVNLVARCKTAEGGYAIGDEVAIGGAGQVTTAQVCLTANATNIIVTVAASGSLAVWNRGTFAQFNITPANWRWVVRAKG